MRAPPGPTAAKPWFCEVISTLARLQVLDRVVGAAVAEGQLERLQADGAAQQLVAEADAPHGLLADERAHGLDDVAERGRVAGAVGEEHGVGVLGEQLLGGSTCTGAARRARRAATSSRTIEALMPVSITAIRGPVAVLAVAGDFARA